VCSTRPIHVALMTRYDAAVHVLRAYRNIFCVQMLPCWLDRGTKTRTIRPPNAMRRQRGEPERCRGAHVPCAQQHMLRAHVSLLTRSRRADLDYATSVRTRCEESAASRRGLCDLRTRYEESAARRRGPKASPNQSELCDLRTRCKESAASRRGLQGRS
jgi:hypothetical protein